MKSEQISQETSLKQTKQPRPRLDKYFNLVLGMGTIGITLVVARPMIFSRSDSNSIEAIAQTESSVLPVTTIETELVDYYQVVRTYTGEIAAVRTSNIGFSRSGELEVVLVAEGERVTKGQPLARLDLRNLQTLRQQLVAEKKCAEASILELKILFISGLVL